MNEKLIDFLWALKSSSKFTQLLKGVSIHTNTPFELKGTLKVNKIEASLASKGYQVAKYSYYVYANFNGNEAIGVGDSHSKLLAIQKAMSEACERVIFKEVSKNHQIHSNSNGWASHISTSKMNHSSLIELNERDAALVHWLSQMPFITIENSSYPKWLKSWIKNELIYSQFNKIQLLLSHLGHLPTITVILTNKNGFSLVSHAGGKNIHGAIKKALIEASRMAEVAAKNIYFNESKLFIKNKIDENIGPEFHSLLYAYHFKLPNWIYGSQYDFNSATQIWNKHFLRFMNHSNGEYVFTEVLSSPLSIGYCTSKNIQNLYFGSTTLNKININRVSKFLNNKEINKEPHFVA